MTYQVGALHAAILQMNEKKIHMNIYMYVCIYVY